METHIDVESFLHAPNAWFCQAMYHLYTCFLFTKSDIKTTLIPISSFALATAPITDIRRLPHVVLWIWLHLLQFDLSNQTVNPAEDMINKKDRPLPAKRITLEHALVLRWAVIPICWAVSYYYSTGVLYSSVALVFFTFAYNEWSAHSHWLSRNMVNGLGMASFEAGATMLAGGNIHTLHRTSILAIAISACIFATTIHTQDFKDEVGDRATGRKTLPILFPSMARYSAIIALTTWSLTLSLIWELDWVLASVFASLALFVGGRFAIRRTVSADQISFYWYNLWLSLAHALPAYYYTYAKK